MSFEIKHEAFMKMTKKGKSGEVLRRLEEGHGYAEKLFLQNVWFPALGTFEQLHPEYEIEDFKDGKRYLDFAYIRSPYRIAIEIDGYSTHCKDVSRWQFADNLVRQNHLILDDWKVIRFSFDEIKDKPRQSQQLIQQMIGKWFGGDTQHQQHPDLNLKEREIVRLLRSTDSPITPKEVSEALNISDRTARITLKSLLAKSVLIPSSGTKRITKYILNTGNNL